MTSQFAFFAGVLGCGPKPGAIPSPDARITPILPAPEALVYTAGGAGTEVPRDPIVADLVAELPWDEALSGAAGALAADAIRAPEWGRAQWAAARAGYPFPLAEMLMESVEPGGRPAGFRQDLERAAADGMSIGVARARGGAVDRWVALIGRPSPGLSPFPREVEEGAELPLVAEPPVAWTVVSPTGVTRSGTTPARPLLDEAGEWWLELRRGEPPGVPIASIPLYAGIATPAEPILDTPGRAAATSDEAAADAVALVGEVRDAFALRVPPRDATLDMLADGPVQAIAGGGAAAWDPAAGEDRLRHAGFANGPVHQIACTGATVALCISNSLRVPRDRAGVLDPDVASVGAAARTGAAGVSVVLNLAAD